MHDVIDIQVTPLSSACGAEISGVDLTRPLSGETIRAIKETWGKHLVLVFRGQKISQDDQLRFASYFGELGDRKKAPEQLRSRAEGIQQDHKKILLVTNIKVDGNYRIFKPSEMAEKRLEAVFGQVIAWAAALKVLRPVPVVSTSPAA